MTKLALLGGDPVRTMLFPAHRNMGAEEREAVNRVMDGGVLSSFIGAWHENFLGGKEVRAFEDEWAEAFSVPHAVSMNSATSGLYAAVGAAGVGPGDEVIVSPYTMTASAVAPLVFNAVPIFADIDPQTYCLSAETIRAKITERTRAVIVVHIFGLPSDMDEIMALAQEHDIVVIEDTAQAPFALYGGRMAGTIGHMGVYSLNYHKHIHTGEGSLVVTRDPDLAERLQLIRNHAEAVVEGKGVANLNAMLGFNFRLGELEAAIGREQLKKGAGLVARRQENVCVLEQSLKDLPGLSMPVVPEGRTHAYYTHPLHYDATKTGVSRDTVVKALKAELPPAILREREGPLVNQGYVRPLYLQPLYQRLEEGGSATCPIRCPHYGGTPDYQLGLCPNVEAAHFKTLIHHDLMYPNLSRDDLADVAAAFNKVFSNLDVLAENEGAS